MGYIAGWTRVYLAMADKGFSERDSAQKAGVDLATVKRQRRQDVAFDDEVRLIEEKFSGQSRMVRW